MEIVVYLLAVENKYPFATCKRNGMDEICQSALSIIPFALFISVPFNARENT